VAAVGPDSHRLDTIDVRNSIGWLTAVVHDEIQDDVYAGTFVFVSRLCDGVKILSFDHGGVVLYHKRAGGRALPAVGTSIRM